MLRIIIIIMGIISLTLLSTNSFKRKPRIEFLFYFTNLSNIFLVLFHLFNINNDIIHFSIVSYLVFTFLIFNFVILPYGRKNNINLKDIGTSKIVSFLVHILLPSLAFINWYIESDSIKYSDFIYVLIFPIIYCIFCITIGKSNYKVKDNPTNYLYPFFDVEKLGWFKVILMIIGLLMTLLIIYSIMFIIK